MKAWLFGILAIGVLALVSGCGTPAPRIEFVGLTFEALQAKIVREGDDVKEVTLGQIPRVLSNSNRKDFIMNFAQWCNSTGGKHAFGESFNSLVKARQAELEQAVSEAKLGQADKPSGWGCVNGQKTYLFAMVHVATGGPDGRWYSSWSEGTTPR